MMPSSSPSLSQFRHAPDFARSSASLLNFCFVCRSGIYKRFNDLPATERLRFKNQLGNSIFATVVTFGYPPFGGYASQQKQKNDVSAEEVSVFPVIAG
jgi:hypothetical protein